jgi:hypothetical protein
MNSNQGAKYPRWERLGTVVFLAYCVSTIFIVFFSISAVQIWPYPWNRISILTASLVPLLSVLVWKIPQLIRDKKLEKKFLFIFFIVILGILNIILSEDQSTTLKIMTLFLLSGMGAFIVSGWIITERSRQFIFLMLCWACLLAFCVYGTSEFLNKKPILLLSFNPIPAGSLLILLFVGPFLLFLSSPRWLRFLQVLSIAFSMALIVMIGKRGPILGLLVMAFLFCTLLPWRKLWIIPLIALILLGSGYKIRNHLPLTLRLNLITHANTLFRLENYVFAAHIFFNKPLFGIGLRSPIAKYLKTYRQKIIKDSRYPRFISELKTLENIILCGFVEMGGIFSITYIALIIYLLRKLFSDTRDDSKKRLKAKLLLIPLAGFFIHSMTFDSLMYPHLNWLFHSYLGLMGNFDKI